MTFAVPSNSDVATQWSPGENSGFFRAHVAGARIGVPARLIVTGSITGTSIGGHMNAQVSQTDAPGQEQTLTSTIFGQVTTKRVIYNRSRGWFSGGSREDIPLAHVTSVRLDTTRHLLGGILLALIGLPMALKAANSNSMQVIGVLLVALAMLLLWGSPTVYVNTAGQDKSRSKGLPWQREQANSFVEAIRQQLVQRQ